MFLYGSVGVPKHAHAFHTGSGEEGTEGGQRRFPHLSKNLGYWKRLRALVLGLHRM